MNSDESIILPMDQTATMHDMSPSMSMGNGTHMMMYFHTMIMDNILFKGWKPTTGGRK